MPIPPRFQLFYSVRSPFARRVRIAMQRLGLEFQAKEENAFDPSAEFLAANPLALLPALVVNGKTGLPADRFAIADSSTILEYLHESHGERIWPSNLETRARVRAAANLAEGLMTKTVAWFLDFQRPSPSPDFLQEMEDDLLRTLDQIAAGSLRQPPWKISDLQLTQAGYDLLVALEYLDLRLAKLGWRDRYPELARFLDSHKVRQDIAPTAPPPA